MKEIGIVKNVYWRNERFGGYIEGSQAHNLYIRVEPIRGNIFNFGDILRLRPQFSDDLSTIDFVITEIEWENDFNGIGRLLLMAKSTELIKIKSFDCADALAKVLISLKVYKV